VPTVALLNSHQTLGDFLESLIFARTVADRMDAKLAVQFANDRPYKRPLIGLLQGDKDAVYAGGADLVLDARKHCDRRFLPGLGKLARLAVPHEHACDCQGAIVIHYREAGCRWRTPMPLREVDAAYVQPIVTHLYARGERIIRIGHECMAPLDGLYMDLSDAPLLKQAYAVSQARLMLEISPSGPAALALGYGVPWLRCNSLVPWGPVETHSVVAMQHVDAPSGEVPTQQFLDLGDVDCRQIHAAGWRWRKMTPAECIRLADMMLSRPAPLIEAAERSLQIPPVIERRHRVMRWGEGMEMAA
jgi:hypothetical protein